MQASDRSLAKGCAGGRRQRQEGHLARVLGHSQRLVERLSLQIHHSASLLAVKRVGTGAEVPEDSKFGQEAVLLLQRLK